MSIVISLFSSWPHSVTCFRWHACNSGFFVAFAARSALALCFARPSSNMVCSSFDISIFISFLLSPVIGSIGIVFVFLFFGNSYTYLFLGLCCELFFSC